MSRVTVSVLFLAAMVLLGGCTNKPNEAQASKPETIAINKWLHEQKIEIPPTTYRVAPPDTLQIQATSIRELNNHTARIRPDGKINLNLVGDVYVAGMSPSEISDMLQRKLRQYYNAESLKVWVDVVTFESKKYYVFGYVNSPGIKPYTGRDTVVKVLADAGLTDDSWAEKVVLVRPHKDHTIKQKVTIDVQKMFMHGQASQDYLLEEGDIIYVPPSPMAEFRMTMEAILAPIRPVADIAIMATTGI